MRRPNPAILLLSIVFLLSLPSTTLVAQDTDELYWIIHHMEPHPGMNHMFAHREETAAMPVHQVAVDEGSMLNWSLYWVQSSTDSEKDYTFVVVRAYRDLEHLNRYVAENAYQRAFPDGAPAFPEEQFHDLLREEIWKLGIHAAEGESGRPGRFAIVNYYDTKEDSETVGQMQATWAALHRARAEAGVISDWNAFDLVMPA